MTQADNPGEIIPSETTVAQPAKVQQSAGKRFLVIVLHMVFWIGASILLAMLISSSECVDQGQCSHGDQIIFAIVAVMDFVLAFILVLLGIIGKLPGAKAS
ncbi:MAG: hypothetical protein ACI8WB_001458 [Phenylobacterium sp.]|jgi:hypothetical protein